MAEDRSQQQKKTPFTKAALRFLKLTSITTLCVLVITAAVLHIPMVQRSLLHRTFAQFGPDIGFRIHADAFRFNLFTGTLRADNAFLVPIPMDTPARLSFRRIELDLSITDLINEHINVDRIAVTHPVLTLEQRNDGSIVWPWRQPAAGSDSEQGIREPETVNSSEAPPGQPFRLTIHNAVLADGKLMLQNISSDTPALSVNGIEMTGSMNFRSMTLNAGLAVENAVWNTPGGEIIQLTEPLSLSARRNGGPIQVNMHTEINRFPLSLTGNFTPETTPFSYQLRVNGDGPVTTILRSFGVRHVEVPALAFESIINSSGGSMPEGTLTATARDITAGTQTFHTVTIAGNLSRDNISTEINARSLDGELRASVQAPSKPMIGVWDQTVDLQNVSLTVLKPWIPDSLDLKGTLNGHLTARGRPADWRGMTVSGHLDISRSDPVSGTDEPFYPSTDSPYPIRPEGTIRLSLDNRRLEIEDLFLADPNHRIKLNGQWNMNTGHWFLDADAMTADAIPWFALGQMNGGGSLELTGRCSGILTFPETGDSPSDASGGMDTSQLLNTLTAELAVQADGLVLEKQPPVTAGIKASVSNGRFQAELEKLVWEDLSFNGRISGDLPTSRNTDQNIAGTLENIVWQGNPIETLALNLRRTPDGEVFALATDGQDLTVNLSRAAAPGTPWTGTATFNAFDLSIVGAFLPDPWHTVSGRLTAQTALNPGADAGTGGASNDFKLTASLENLVLEIMDRTVRSAGVGRIAFDNDGLRVSNVVLTGDDGSRLAANGHLALRAIEAQEQSDGSAGKVSAMALDISVPDLSRWRIPGLPENDKGSLSLSVLLKGSWPDLQPSGTISSTGLVLAGRRFGDLRLTLSDPPDRPGVTIGFAVDEYQPGGGIRMNARGQTTLSRWLDGIEYIRADTRLNQLDTRLDSLEYSLAAPLDVSLADGNLTVAPFRITGPGFEALGSGFLPLLEPRDDAKMNLSVETRLHPFETLNLDIGDLNGAVSAVLEITGSLTEPVITGSAAIESVNWDSPLMPGPVENFGGSIQITSEAATLSEVTLDFAGGRVEITGGLSRSGIGIDAADIRLTARDMALDYASDLQLQGSAELWLRGEWPGITAGGTVLFRDVLYTPDLDLIGVLTRLPEQRLVIEETDVSGDRDGDIGGRPGLPLDFSIIAHDGIRIQNPHMNLGLAARLQVTGTSQLPGVLGTVTFNRGTIDLLLHEFEITGGSVNFTQPYELNPGIDITATTEVKDELITLRITGSADAPNLLLSSETGKSHAEIMNMLLGRDALGDDRDLADLAADYARQAVAIAAAEAISTRTDLIVIPFPESLEGEDLLFGVGRKFGDRWTVMYYFGEKSEEGDAVEVDFEVSPKSDIRLRQNQDGSFSGGFRYRETFN